MVSIWPLAGNGLSYIAHAGLSVQHVKPPAISAKRALHQIFDLERMNDPGEEAD